MDDVRKILEQAAVDQGKPLAELSRGAGRNHAYLQQFINRGVPARLPEDVRHYLSRQLGLSEEQLGRRITPPPSADPDLAALLEIYDRLPPRSKKAVLAAAEAFADRDLEQDA